jgi:hypothetical protein
VTRNTCVALPGLILNVPNAPGFRCASPWALLRRAFSARDMRFAINSRLRPEGPLVYSPGRQAGVKDMTKLSAEGAVREAPMVSRLQRSIAS